jgi:hypothetical protein
MVTALDDAVGQVLVGQLSVPMRCSKQRSVFGLKALSFRSH